MLRSRLLRGEGVIEPERGEKWAGVEWQVLAAKLRPFVARRVRAADVDDVLQEILLRVQQGVPSLRDDARLGPFVYRVARNAVIDHLRRGARSRETLTAELDLAASDVAEQEGEAAQEMASYAAMFVAFLPSPYREALTLTELSGMTQTEAAEMLGISVSGMKSRVQRGRRLLREALLECCAVALDGRNRVVSYAVRADGKLPSGCCPSE